MNVTEAEAQIKTLRHFVRIEKERLKAEKEAALVEAYGAAKQLCAEVAERMGLDPWLLFGTHAGSRYPRIRGIIYWELHRRGYSTKMIGQAFGRRSDIEAALRRVEMKMRITPSYKEYVNGVLGR